MFIYLDCGEDIKESENIASLHKQIAACDQILQVNSLQWVTLIFGNQKTVIVFDYWKQW